MDIANVVWSEVTGLCGFWDGGCETGVCGAGIMFQVLHYKIWGGSPFTKSAARCGAATPWMPNWEEEIGNRRFLIWPFMKPIENSNLKASSCIKLINGLIRLREK